MKPTTQTPAKTLKLLTFGVISLVIALSLTFGLYLPYLEVYSIVHPPRRTPIRFPQDVGITQPYKDVQFVTSDGLTIKGWYIPPQNGAVVIFVHGQAMDRAELLDEAGFIVQAGYGALLLDMRAHGQSDGTVSTLGVNEPRDIHAAVDFIHTQAGAKTPIALIGHSIGSGVSLIAAAEMPEIRAVIAESTFTTLEENVYDLTQVLTGLPTLLTPLLIFYTEQQTGINIHSVRPIDVISKISPRAVLLIHGEKDVNFPVRNAYRMYDAAREPKQRYIIPNVAHNNFLKAAPKQYPKTILSFLQTYLK